MQHSLAIDIGAVIASPFAFLIRSTCFLCFDETMQISGQLYGATAQIMLSSSYGRGKQDELVRHVHPACLLCDRHFLQYVAIDNRKAWAQEKGDPYSAKQREDLLPCEPVWRSYCAREGRVIKRVAGKTRNDSSKHGQKRKSRHHVMACGSHLVLLDLDEGQSRGMSSPEADGRVRLR